MADQIFNVRGCFDVSRHGGRGHWMVTTESARAFWRDEPQNHWAAERGVYVFGLKNGGNFTPWYVGKTDGGLGQ